MKFDYPDINELLAAESRAAAAAAASADAGGGDHQSRFPSANGSASVPTATWSRQETVDVLEAIRLHGPNFFLIAGKVPTKNVNQIRKFYFVNKRRYNLDRMDRRQLSGRNFGYGGEEGSIDGEIEAGGGGCGGGGDVDEELDRGGDGIDRLFGPAEVVAPQSTGDADSGQDGSAAPSIEGRPDSSSSIPFVIPPEPRPVRQARARRIAKYVEDQSKSSSSEEEEDLAETDEEDNKRKDSDDEVSDPNFEGEEEEEEEGSDYSDPGDYGKGRRKRKKTTRLFNHSLLASSSKFDAAASANSTTVSTTTSTSTAANVSSSTPTLASHRAPQHFPHPGLCPMRPCPHAVMTPRYGGPHAPIGGRPRLSAPYSGRFSLLSPYGRSSSGLHPSPGVPRGMTGSTPRVRSKLHPEDAYQRSSQSAKATLPNMNEGSIQG